MWRRFAVPVALSVVAVVLAACGDGDGGPHTEPVTTDVSHATSSLPSASGVTSTVVTTTQPTAPTSMAPEVTTTSEATITSTSSTQSEFDLTYLIGQTIFNDDVDALPEGSRFVAASCLGDPEGDFCSHSLFVASSGTEVHLLVLRRMIDRVDVPDGWQRISWLVVDALAVEVSGEPNVIFYPECWSDSVAGHVVGVGPLEACATVTPIRAWIGDWRTERIVEAAAGQEVSCQQACD